MPDPAQLLDGYQSDVQAGRPATRVALSRVGVTGVSRVIRLRPGGADAQLFQAGIDCYVDLGPAQRGVHMSRFDEALSEAIDEVVLGSALRAETLAARVAERVRERQGAVHAEVTIAARYPEERRAPASGARTQELHTLFGTAVAGPHRTRRLVGVEAQGMTACPCAQELVTARARGRLEEDGFSDEEIERVLRHVPVATHNQRGLGTLHVGYADGCEKPIEAEQLVRIVESAMSSEIYELMKRSDEVEVVERAHRRPRFVEDCVREMVRMGTEAFAGLGGGGFLMARQVNLETIHSHRVVAERHGLLEELRAELDDGETPSRHTSMRDWLEGPAG